MPQSYDVLEPRTKAFAAYVSQTYGVNYPNGYDGGYRPAGSVAGETGVHASKYAFDIPVDQNTPIGRRIAADLRARNVFVYTDKHGTGPHIHVETNRNADGSPKGGR